MTTLKSNANDMINNNAADNVMSAAELQEAAAVQADAPARESVKEEKILEEMKEKRTADTKYFRTENHGGIIAVYPSPVHYEENGEWKEIDNSLEEDNNEGEGYQNKNAAMKVKFAKHGKSKKLVTIHKGSNKISWGLEAESKETTDTVFRVYEEKDSAGNEEDAEEAAADIEADIAENAAASEDVSIWNRKQVKVKHQRSGGIYEDILNGISLEYYLEGERLKENIILKDKEAAMIPLTFRITHKKLRLEAENGDLVFYNVKENTDESVYRMKAPCMFEKNTGVFGDVHYEAEAVSESETLLTIAADQEWLSAEGRQFPVIIDPNMETAKTSSAIMDTFVRKKQPSSSVVSSYGSFCVGNNDAYGQCYGLVKFTQLPVLPAGAVLYHAYIGVCQYSFSAYNGQPFYVTAHQITGSWSEGSVTWNTKPQFNAEVLDLKQIKDVAVSGGIQPVFQNFNVTKLARQWYASSSSNQGILLKLYDESVQSDAYFVSADYPTDDGFGITSDMFPTGSFYYRDANGLEDYYSYHKQNVGRAGTGYVNDFNGNLVLVHKDTQTSGRMFPASVSHIYNLSMRNDNSKCMGYGWRLSAHQELKASGITDYPYYYIDGDGTKHYFYKDTSDGNKLKDEDGLGYVITTTSSTNENAYFVMETKAKVKMEFHKDGTLRKETDLNGNSIYYYYSSGKLTHLCEAGRNGAIDHIIYLTYGSDNNLASITDEVGRNISYTYENGNLRTIVYPDVLTENSTSYKTSRYGYSTSGHELMYVKAPDGYEMDYTYITDCGVRRVQTIKERNNSVYGQEIRITYNNGMQTVYEEPGIDGMLSQEEDNRTYTYQFDNCGRVCCVSDQDGNGASYNYFVQGQKNNKISLQGSTMKTVNNGMLNGRFQDGTLNNWTKYPTSTSQVSVDTAVGYIGKSSVKITRTSIADSITAVQQSISLGEGAYTVSAYVKVSDLTTKTSDTDTSTNRFVGISVKAINSAGNSVELGVSPGIRENTDTDVDGGWQREILTFNMPRDYQTAVITAGIFRAKGTANMTCFQLENGTAANKYNLVENGNFELEDSNHVPLTFSGILTNSAGDGSNASQSKFSSKSLRIFGEPGKRKGFWKKIPVTGTGKDIFTVSGWAKGTSVPDGEFGISVGFQYTDGTYKWKDISFNKFSTDWQFVSEVVSPAEDGNTDREYQAVDIRMYYGNNANDAWFDGLMMIRDDAQSYVYDDNGNLISAKTAAEQSGFSNDKDGNLSKMMDVTGSSFEYGYDDKKNLKRGSSAERVVYQFEYNNCGSPTRTVAYGDRFHGAVTPGKNYYIREKVSGKYLDVTNGQTTAVQLYEFNESHAQKWKVEDAGSGYIRLIPAHATGMALEVKNGASVDGTAIVIHTKDKDAAQRFKLRMTERGEYQILAKCSSDKRCLTNAANSTANGASVTLWAANDTYNRQLWYFEPADGAVTDTPEDGNIFAIRTRHSGQYLNIGNVTPAVGNGVSQYYHNGCDWQCFRLQKVGTPSDAYYIRPIYAPTMALARAGQDSDGRNLITLQTYQSGNTAQIFRFINEGNAYVIKNPASGEEFGIKGTSYTAGASVVTAVGLEGAHSQNMLFILEDKGKRLESSMTYTTWGRQVASVKDSRGFVTTNTYTGQYEHLLDTVSVKDQAGTVVSHTQYTYDSQNDRITAVTGKVSPSSSTASVQVQYGYDEGDRLKTITHNGFTYQYEYDSFGNQTAVKVGSQTLESNTYYANNGPLESVTYANGYEVKNTYDNNFRLINQKKGKTGDWAETVNEYDEYDNLQKREDKKNGITYRYRYDLTDRLNAMDNTRGQKVRIAYDDKNRVSSIINKVGEHQVKTGFVYGDAESGQLPGLLYKLRADGTNRSILSYDSMARLQSRLLSGTGNYYRTSYTYVPGEKEWMTTTLVECLNNNGTPLYYTYDARGNIETIREGSSRTLKATYYYDGLNRLIREDNKWDNKTVCYTYNAGGNMLTRKEYAYTTGTLGTVNKTTTYTYGNTVWKDQLTRISVSDGTSSTIGNYDSLGNPRTYRGMSMDWKNGRELASVTKGGYTYQFAYDSDGNRISKKKTYNQTVLSSTEYYLNGSTILGINKDGQEVLFVYDQDGKPFAMKVIEGTDAQYYYYIYNVQGDVIGLVDKSGTQVVTYIYDSWGKLLPDSTTSTLASMNPFRYRGYCYDEETGFYYVSSRYYDPEIGRWINADIPETLTADFENFAQYNLFAYCFNNPVNLSDETGAWPSWATKLAIGVGAIVIGAAVVAATAATGGAAAAFVGAAFAGLKSAAVSGAIGAAVGAGISAVSHRVSTGSWSGAGKAAIDGAVDGFASGFMTGGIMAGGSQILSSGFKVAANAGVPTGRNGD